MTGLYRSIHILDMVNSINKFDSFIPELVLDFQKNANLLVYMKALTHCCIVVFAHPVSPKQSIYKILYSKASNSTSSAASTASTASKATTATTAGAATATGPSSEAEWLTKLLKCCYYLQLSEVLGLCVISFVHNREHYREYISLFSHPSFFPKKSTKDAVLT